MAIVDLTTQPDGIRDQAAVLLSEAFPDADGLHDLGRRHPFQFYRKLGYVVTGVMPDANGRGRPDIYMSKAL